MPRLLVTRMIPRLCPMTTRARTSTVWMLCELDIWLSRNDFQNCKETRLTQNLAYPALGRATFTQG